MDTKTKIGRGGETIERRDLLRYLGAGAVGLALAGHGPLLATRARAAELAGRPGRKLLQGLFPIASTPYTENDKLDLECLVNEVKFCNKGGVHGMIWPQIASGWTVLREDERLAGAEAILAANKGERTALIIGVQSLHNDMAEVERYATHAKKNGADGLCALPPADVDDEKALLEYYQKIGAMTDLPLFVQSQRAMSIDLIVEIFNTVPTMRQVKDETTASDPLDRVGELRKRTSGQLNVFSGKGARTMITEMERGFMGHCPTVALADVYAQAFDLWHAGRRVEAFDMFGRILAFGSMGGGANNAVLIARGVFKPTTHTRSAPLAAGVEPEPGAAGRGARAGGTSVGPTRIPAEEALAMRKALDTYLKPYLRGDLV